MVKFSCCILALAAAICAGSLAWAETLRVQTSFSASDFSTRFLNENWVPKLKAMTGGRVEIELLAPKAVVPHRETPEAVAAGILDGDFTSTSYFTDRDPAFALLGDLVAGYETPAQMRGFCKEGGGEAALQKALDSFTGGNVVVIGCGSYTREALVAAKPIRTFADLKGKKIRSPEGLPAAVFAEAGATPVSVPLSEVYVLMEKNIVDATDASAYANNDATGLHKIAKYPLYPGIHSMPSMQFTVAKAKYDAFSAPDRDALREWWYQAMEAMDKAVDEQDKALVERDKAGGDIEVIDWAKQDRERMRAAAQKAWAEFAAKSPLAKSTLAAHLNYMKSIGLLK